MHKHAIQSTKMCFFLGLANNISWPRQALKADAQLPFGHFCLEVNQGSMQHAPYLEKLNPEVQSLHFTPYVLFLQETISHAVFCVFNQNTMKRQHPRLKQLFKMSETVEKSRMKMCFVRHLLIFHFVSRFSAFFSGLLKKYSYQIPFSTQL